MESISQTQIKQAVDIKSTSPGEARLMDQRVPRIPKQSGSESKGKGSLQRFLSWGINKIQILFLKDSSGSLIAKLKAVVNLSNSYLSVVPNIKNLKSFPKFVCSIYSLVIHAFSSL